MNAPSVTIEEVEAAILEETYTLLPNGRTTVCQLTLFDNGDTGFTVEGQSACVSKANYNEEKGRYYARQRAVDKVWEMLGYGLAKEIDHQRKLGEENFHDRLRREYASLQLRMQKLGAWLETPQYLALSIEEQDDQKEQFVLMKQYSEILDRRLARLATKI